MQLMSFCSTPGAIGLIVNTASLVIENRLWKPTNGAKKKFMLPGVCAYLFGKIAFEFNWFPVSWNRDDLTIITRYEFLMKIDEQKF